MNDQSFKKQIFVQIFSNGKNFFLLDNQNLKIRIERIKNRIQNRSDFIGESIFFYFYRYIDNEIDFFINDV